MNLPSSRTNHAREVTVPLPIPDTPFHGQLSARMPQTSTSLFQEPAFIQAAGEMKGMFWGPVPVENFLDEFFPVTPPRLPNVNPGLLAAVAEIKVEKEMYDPLIKALKPFCKGITLLNTSNVADPSSGVLFDQCIKPDIGIYDDEDLPRPGECITQAKSMTGFGELKNDPLHEPFHLVQPPYSIGARHPFERDTAHARDTRGQLTLYANAIQATQFRTHSFSFFINKTNCRLIHWSRSGAIVTEVFNLIKTNWLPWFFWCLSHAEKDVRGTDTTFVDVTNSTEAQKAHEAFCLGPVDRDPLYQVPVEDDVTKQTTYYIVNKPFTNNHVFPVGRGTRCFKAYDCQTGAIVLLKDTWRVAMYELEGDIYRDLHAANVRNIAKFITAGDVGHVCGQTEKFDAIPGLCVQFHYRLVLGTVGTPLTRFSSTWGMVKATTDALIAHWDAVTKANILHRDVSSGNIIFVGEEKGILIDWELCKRISEDPEPIMSPEIGTWQFISARLLLNNGQEHRVGDDLESFVHVLTWAAIKYAQNTLTTEERTRLLKKFDSVYNGVGGGDKAEFLSHSTPAITSIYLQQKPFSNVLKRIYLGFGHRYMSEKQEELQLVDKESAEMELEKLETHDWLLDILQKALDNDEWKHDRDGRVDQEVLADGRNWTAGQEKKRKSMISEYEDKPDEKRCKRD